MTATAIPTAVELRDKVRELNPHGRYAAYATGSAVGEWVPSRDRFCPIYERFIDGRWCCTIVNGMIRETMVNGASVYDPAKWVE